MHYIEDKHLDDFCKYDIYHFMNGFDDIKEDVEKWVNERFATEKLVETYCHWNCECIGSDGDFLTFAYDTEKRSMIFHCDCEDLENIQIVKEILTEI